MLRGGVIGNEITDFKLLEENRMFVCMCVSRYYGIYGRM